MYLQVFLDPVCFLLHHADILFNVVYRGYKSGDMLAEIVRTQSKIEKIRLQLPDEFLLEFPKSRCRQKPMFVRRSISLQEVNKHFAFLSRDISGGKCTV